MVNASRVDRTYLTSRVMCDCPEVKHQLLRHIALYSQEKKIIFHYLFICSFVPSFTCLFKDWTVSTLSNRAYVTGARDGAHPPLERVVTLVQLRR